MSNTAGDDIKGAWSGNGVRGLDNPSAQSTPDLGPIPRGPYKMRARQFSEDTNSRLRGRVLVLEPIGHDAQKRKSLLVHGYGGDKAHASTGCIIVPADQDQREKLFLAVTKGDNLIWVDF
jgi:hypothetical protein